MGTRQWPMSCRMGTTKVERRSEVVGLASAWPEASFPAPCAFFLRCHLTAVQCSLDDLERMLYLYHFRIISRLCSSETLHNTNTTPRLPTWSEHGGHAKYGDAAWSSRMSVTVADQVELSK